MDDSTKGKNIADDTKSPSVIGGACIIASVCVGAGMLGLPTAGAGAWTWWTLIALIFTMGMMTLSGCLLLEAFKEYPFKSSFSTVTCDLLGKPMMWFNNLMVYFVGGILLYAYITSSGLIISSYIDINEKVAAIVFVAMFSLVVWHSTHFVDRFSIMLIVFMGGSFLFGVSGLLSNVTFTVLRGEMIANYSQYIWTLFPIALASFGYHHTVSTMRDYYQSEKKAQNAIVGGAFIALVIYIIWLISVYGNLPRANFSEVIAAGGDVDVLVKSLDRVITSELLSDLINIFSSAAILSSFVGVGLGLFDFLADVFGFDDTYSGRTKTWAVTFIPPLIVSLLFPFGFLIAIGFAASAAAIWACIVPALLVRKVRLNKFQEKLQSSHKGEMIEESGYRVIGGDWVLFGVGIFGVMIICVHILNILEILPKFIG